MKKLAALILSVILAMTMLTGCGGNEGSDTQEAQGTQTTKTGNSDETKPLKVALCVTGAVNDMGWCQSAYDGLLLVEKELGAQIAHTENLDVADMAATFTDYAASGYDVVIGHGFQFGDPALEVAEQFPDTKFICIEADASAENVASYVMKCEESGYLLGMLAASMSKSDKLGFIGPVQGASLVKIMNGFEDGAKSIKPAITVQKTWTGSFTDTALAKEAATAMIEGGVDVVGHCANECGTGAINAAKEAGIFATGDSFDQNELAPDTILTSGIYNVPQLIKTAVLDVQNGSFKGEVKQLGMKEGIVEIAPYHNLDSTIPEETKKLINDKIEEIKSGAFEVPCDTSTRK